MYAATRFRVFQYEYAGSEIVAGSLFLRHYWLILHPALTPVLKHERAGNLLRLWPPPGPDIPEVQRVKVEWATIRLTNRYYVMERSGMQRE